MFVRARRKGNFHLENIFLFVGLAGEIYFSVKHAPDAAVFLHSRQSKSKSMRCRGWTDIPCFVLKIKRDATRHNKRHQGNDPYIHATHRAAKDKVDAPISHEAARAYSKSSTRQQRRLLSVGSKHQHEERYVCASYTAFDYLDVYTMQCSWIHTARYRCRVCVGSLVRRRYSAQ